MQMDGTNESNASRPGSGRIGRFYLQELINSGGMADIWLVNDGHGKPFALRCLLDGLKWNLLSRHRFVRGCKILRDITPHENIISYLEHGSASGRLYLLMEYVEAANLKELYVRHDPVLLENVASIILQTASALEHMHERGYMHLDFKPENVLVTRNASVRLIDFDIALPIPKKPVQLRKNPGTPGYMAPEQLQKKPIDARVDIFAFGVAAYELLTNQKPFPGETPGEILARQLDRSGFVRPRQHHEEIPARLETIILKCIETDPDKRYPFMSVLAHELRSALYL